MLDRISTDSSKLSYVADLPDFSAIDPDTAKDKIAVLLTACREAVSRCATSPEARGPGLVLGEIEASDALELFWSSLSHLHTVADNEELRAAYNDCLAELTQYSSWRQQHEGLYTAYRQLRDSGDYQELPPGLRRIVDLELRDFHLAGVDLAAEQKSEYREVMQRLSDLGARFAQNLLDATQAWQLHIEDSGRLAGLPDSEMNMLAGLAQAQDLGGWLVDLSFPSYNAVLTFAEDRKLRHAVYSAFTSRASDKGPHAGEYDNSPLIKEFLSLRHRLARLLDFEQYFDLALATRMAETRSEVEAFLSELAERALPAAGEQLDELTALAADEGAEVPLAAWDISFWAERLRQRELNLSDELLKPYFPLDEMLEGLRFVVRQLFAVELEHDSEIKTWHEDVRFYWLLDDDGNRFGGIYFDLYVRAGKRDGAWMDVCRSRRLRPEGVQMPVAHLVCNFPAPASNMDQPSLLTHNEVRTLFHEAGHGFHHLLTTVDWPQINGITNVEWDAVELPSQLFENWAWSDAFLSRFALHFETGERLPEDMRRRMRRARHFHKAMVLVKQIEFAMVDLRLHGEYDPESPRDPLEVLGEVRDQFAVVPVPPENRFLNSFSHIFGGGYSAGYYSYLWAEELAADAWGRFRESGEFDSSAGVALRSEILGIGSSRPAMESFIAFRGRKPRPGPLLESYGLED